MIGLLLNLALMSQAHASQPITEPGSGIRWMPLYAWGREGPGHPDVCLQLATSPDFPGRFRASVYESSYSNKGALLSVQDFPGSIRFRRIELYANPVNDIWDENGETYKQFPHLLFVAQGIEDGKPTSLVFDIAEGPGWKVRQLLKVFDADARRLSGKPHGSRDPGGTLVERADASWLTLAERGRLAGPVERRWRFIPFENRFEPDPWRRAPRRQARASKKTARG